MSIIALADDIRHDISDLHKSKYDEHEPIKKCPNVMQDKDFVKMLKTPITKEFLESPAGKRACKKGEDDFHKMYIKDEPSK